MFNIPVVLFFMKRTDNTLKVLSRISKVQPKKLYLISDQGRTEEEKEKVAACRKEVEKHITWPCEVIKDYAEENMGILDRIGYGAKRVLTKEKCAIFLEDDNMPEESFFYFCEEMLEKYKQNSNILWICGTNYLETYESPYGYSYVFTKHTLPCGWATWSEKYLSCYDGELKGLDSSFISDNYDDFYSNKRLERQKKEFIISTKKALARGNKKVSWDHQMTFTLMSNRMYGIAPCVNLIQNIGVDSETTHGGATLRNPMTKRFCGMKSKEIKFPLVDPPKVIEDKIFEKKIGDIICIPRWYMLGIRIAEVIRKIFGISSDVSFSQILFSIGEKNEDKNQ